MYIVNSQVIMFHLIFGVDQIGVGATLSCVQDNSIV